MGWDGPAGRDHAQLRSLGLHGTCGFDPAGRFRGRPRYGQQDCCEWVSWCLLCPQPGGRGICSPSATGALFRILCAEPDLFRTRWGAGARRRGKEPREIPPRVCPRAHSKPRSPRPGTAPKRAPPKCAPRTGIARTRTAPKFFSCHGRTSSSNPTRTWGAGVRRFLGELAMLGDFFKAPERSANFGHTRRLPSPRACERGCAPETRSVEPPDDGRPRAAAPRSQRGASGSRRAQRDAYGRSALGTLSLSLS